MAYSLMPIILASDGCDQRLSQDEFRARQQAFITKEAGLTEAEAADFFPLYFELQNRKKALNDEVWKLLREGRHEDTTEALYEDIMGKVYDARISSNQLEKSYFEKFKKILSCKKIYLVQRAEMRFSRDLLRDMRNNDKAPKGPPHDR